MIQINKNNLSNNLSPYLKQHKNNPVNWQTWRSETLTCKTKFKAYSFEHRYASCH